MSRLRARCPDCRAYTAVALGPEYQCHACGRTFAAGLVRAPRAFGEGGEAMAEAALLDLPYPEAAVVEEDSLGEQTAAVVSSLPERPLVLGGCCCAHLGAVEALAARHGRIAVVWLDAHGDLNTLASSQSGNEWGMPLRMLLDGGTVVAEDVVLIGARNLDPSEREYLAGSALRIGADGIQAALAGTNGVYVALDSDVLRPGAVTVFMPEPGGPTLPEVERMLEALRRSIAILGAGLTGLVHDGRNVEPLARLCEAMGF